MVKFLIVYRLCNGFAQMIIWAVGTLSCNVVSVACSTRAEMETDPVTVGPVPEYGLSWNEMLRVASALPLVTVRELEMPGR